MKLFSTLVLLMLWTATSAQNLIPNPGFEDFSICPGTYGYLDNAVPWFKPTSGSSDYFNSCAAVSSNVSVPVNYAGAYQQARSGVAYAGVAAYKNNYVNYREYMEAPLTVTLEKDKCYFFEMFVNQQDHSKYAINAFGAAFVNGPKQYSTSTTINIYPDVKNNNNILLDDTVTWMAINGYFNAIGDEDYVIIGNFFTDVQTATVASNPASTDVYAYYYVDDVSLYKLDVKIGTCKPLSDSVYVSFVDPPSLFNNTDTNACEGYPLKLRLTADSANYLWNTGSTQSMISVNFAESYSVTVNNACGEFSDTINVAFVECNTLIYVPNAFTPNSDGLNDCFGAKGDNIESYHMVIYDRWGQQVFESFDLHECWDGKIRGREADSGVYVYYITFEGIGLHITDREGFKTGHINLIR